MVDFFDDDFDEHDDFDYDDFEADRFYDDDTDNDIDDISNGEGSGKPDIGRTGLTWYELAFLCALADELSHEKKRRRRNKRDPTHLKRKS
jgi:hypothetical protein